VNQRLIKGCYSTVDKDNFCHNLDLDPYSDFLIERKRKLPLLNRQQKIKLGSQRLRIRMPLFSWEVHDYDISNKLSNNEIKKGIVNKIP
jgi:hypothetical protein